MTQNTDKPFRWGVLGFGKIARTQLLPAMQSVGHSVVAVGSQQPGGAVPELPHIVRSDHAAVLANPDVDAVYIAAPNHMHLPLTLAALRAGKPVLCEKPMVLSSAALRQVQHLADAKGLYVQEAFMVAHHPQWQALRASAAQSLGKLRLLQVNFSYDNRDPTNIRNAHADGGGGLWDIGCYAVWVGQWFMGREPDEVACQAIVHPSWGVDVHCQGQLQWHGEDGPTLLQFSVSTQRARQQSVTLVGDVGWAEVVVPFNPGPETVVRLRSPGAIADAATRSLPFGPVNQYANMVQSFAQAVGSGQAVDLADSWAITRTLERLRRSAGLVDAHEEAAKPQGVSGQA
jgi:predicted dehydrogenase